MPVITTYSFTTTAIDAVSPSLSNQSTAPDEEEVAVSSSINLDISDDVGGSGLDISTLKVFLNLIQVYDGSQVE